MLYCMCGCVCGAAECDVKHRHHNNTNMISYVPEVYTGNTKSAPAFIQRYQIISSFSGFRGRGFLVICGLSFSRFLGFWVWFGVAPFIFCPAGLPRSWPAAIRSARLDAICSRRDSRLIPSRRAGPRKSSAIGASRPDKDTSLGRLSGRVV